jgi:hexokinase
MAIMLPVTALSHSKFNNRPDSWKSQATNVLVNTEYSMFGKGILPATRWDELLNRKHRRPDFQPFEYLMGGHYLSEIVRLVLIEAISTAKLFKGQVPERLLEPYMLDTSTLAAIEG